MFSSRKVTSGTFTSGGVVPFGSRVEYEESKDHSVEVLFLGLLAVVAVVVLIVILL